MVDDHFFLRDLFAAIALYRMADPGALWHYRKIPDDVARAAYGFADAMMEARKRHDNRAPEEPQP